jgi:phage tail sheath protein FI
MTDNRGPRVYVGESGGSAARIQGVDTSTAGFVGQTERGSLQPQLVTSWSEYRSRYGGSVDGDSSAGCIYLPYAVRGFFENGGQRAYIARVTPAGATPASVRLIGSAGATLITAVGPGLWGNNILLRIAPPTLSEQGTDPTCCFSMTLLYFRKGVPNPFLDPTDPNNAQEPGRVDPDLTEEFVNLSTIQTDHNFADSAVNGTSALISIRIGGRPDDVGFLNGRLQNGSAGTDALLEDRYRGSGEGPLEMHTGLAALAGIRDLSILSIPDDVVLPVLRTDLLKQCESLKDRFAVLSATEGEQSGDISQVLCPGDSSYGAYYIPWICVDAQDIASGQIMVPPSGHVAGIYARTDRNSGVHKAPANEVVEGLLDDHEPILERTISENEQRMLNPRGVNVIRDFRAMGRGVLVWGARTMSSDPEWKYVNLRRLLIFLEHSIDRGTQWAAFEPNNEQTWALIKESISEFLRCQWLNGALLGSKDDHAFFVKCDRTTMTQSDIDNGRLICLIGIAPVKPAEFVIFHIAQKTLGPPQN